MISITVSVDGGTKSNATMKAQLCSSGRSLHFQLRQYRTVDRIQRVLFCRSQTAPLPNHKPHLVLKLPTTSHKLKFVHGSLLLFCPRFCEVSLLFPRSTACPSFPKCWVPHHSSSGISNMLMTLLFIAHDLTTSGTFYSLRVFSGPSA